ncbi:triose-phosphate isomerase [Patescibacteria group bacterium]|nr:triose-phosphate isomerase [Patescibacteria group bacterium]
MKKNKIRILINLKTYNQGEKVLSLAESLKKVNQDIILGAQATDIKEIVEKTGLRVYAQHVDYFETGRNTGYILPEAVKANKAQGVLLNHSEHKLKFLDIEKTVYRCKKLGLKTMIFVSSLKEAKKIEILKPDYIVFEPPKLVGGDISVSNAKPEIIREIAKNIKTKFLVGAGIKTREDVIKAIELGASGIGISSAITLAKNPSKKLKELVI